ncbi:DNA alkylation repair protein [Clostridium sp. Mt-5]|uniref:DNA alkylation repair protein n=1 Tax=Clostridium moutaii TaxID=3240932 RepID=A0ABV4BM54_9CLOT
MPQALKDTYSRKFLNDFADKVKNTYKIFDKNNFLNSVMDNTWDELKLKQRVRKISQTLGTYLPETYGKALEILLSICESCTGFPYLFFPDFVEVYGQKQEDWEISMRALEYFTVKSSSEFAVRPFFIIDEGRMIKQMIKWSKNGNEHVRRLSSEGCRPRLPWGQSLTMFKHDPDPVISVLENLKCDPSLYVRKSVANNLNDISKDNPSVVIDIIKSWKGVNRNTDWILRYGSRTLIQKSNPQVMKLFGYEKLADGFIVKDASLCAEPSELEIGDSCSLSYSFYVRGGGPVHIRIEYAIDFVKARGNTSRKKFFLSDKTVSGGEKIMGNRVHKWGDLTTRKHYPGKHYIFLLINGCEVGSVMINLKLKVK